MNAKNIIIFGLGFAAGAVTSAVYLKDKFAQIAQEEIDSIKEAYGMQSASHENPVTDNKPDFEADMASYEKTVENSGYTNYTEISTKNKPGKKNNKNVEKTETDIEVINPNEFGDILDYDQIELTYYSDGVLCDNRDELVEDIEATVGLDFATHFGEYEDDAVHIKNDKLKAYYEIIRDNRKFAEVIR